jgi:hypothetical protein
MLKLALTARWIAALLFCLMLAVGFSLMAQWQVGRTAIENATNNFSQTVKIVDLQSIAKPNQSFTFNEVVSGETEAVLTKVKSQLKLNPREAVLIDNRIQQNGDSGYWVVLPAKTLEAEIWVAVGFINNSTDVQSVLDQIRSMPESDRYSTYLGRYLPSEAPVESVGLGEYSSLSVSQLINQESEFRSAPSYTGFLAITGLEDFKEVTGLEPLTLGLPQGDNQVNWLSAFYAIEWTVFAGFAVFMWWRLLADSYKKQQLAILSGTN